MTDIDTIMRRFYHDGPDIPDTPELQTAEREYRKAFLAAAREAANWHEPDEAALKKAWNARRRARRRAEESVDGAFVLYRPGHTVPASRTRGRVHGFEFVKQCFDELKEAGVPVERIRPQVIVPWVEHVARWAERDIPTNTIYVPPRPDEILTKEQRRMLEKVIHPDPKQARAILQRLAEVTREFLDWLWPGRIPLGKLTLLAGDPGLGKSFVTLDIASRVSRGAAWPDMPLFKTTAGGVILFNAEDDLADTIAPHILLRPTLYSDWPKVTKAEIEADAARVVDHVSDQKRIWNIPVPWQQHDIFFTRAALHLRYRAEQAGVLFAPTQLCAGYRFGLSAGLLYDRALGDEPAKMREATFQEIKEQLPPQEFVHLWIDDTSRWKPDPEEEESE